MAEASFKSFMTSELKKTTGGSLRRHSTGKSSSINNSLEYVPPHYLRASTGSCHDFCKYGKKQAVEESEVLAAKKKAILAKSKPSHAEANVPDPTESSFLGRKKAPLAKLKSIPVQRTRLYDAHEPQNSKRCLSGNEMPKSRNRSSDGHEVSKLRTHVSNGREVTKLKRCVSDASKAMKQEVSSSEEVCFSLKTASEADDSNMFAKRATSLKPKSSAVKLLHSIEPAAGGLRNRRNNDLKVVEEAAGHNRVAGEKIGTPPVTSTRPYLSRVASSKLRKPRSLKIVSPHKNQNKIRKSEAKQHDEDEVQEKTLYVITTETENKLSESDQNESCENKPDGFDQNGSFAVEFCSLPPKFSSPKDLSPLPSLEKEVEEEEEEEEEEDNLEESMGIETTFRKASKVHAEDNIEPEKLSFRRGKVLDILSENSTNGPRRLKFRRGRLLEEKQDVKIGAVSRSMNPREVEGETKGSEVVGSEQVVLRHQDVEEKRDAKGLLNNVIEETASKLVGTQKSKVKALVGAFETVISLQEHKPFATTVN